MAQPRQEPYPKTLQRQRRTPYITHPDGSRRYIEMPNLSLTATIRTVQDFIMQMAPYHEVHGCKKLLKSLHNYLRHLRRCEEHYHTAQAALDAVNGIESPLKRDSHIEHRLRLAAQKFFSNMTTHALQQQCLLFNLPYTAYETTDDIIDALIDAYILSNMQQALDRKSQSLNALDIQ